MPVRVLVLEADPALRDLMDLILQREGYQVETFSDSERAIAAIEKNVPDIAIIEMLLPKLNGLDVIHRCRQNPETDKVRFILLSSFRFEEVVQQALSLGVRDYIVKPFDTDFFAERVARVLQMSPDTTSFDLDQRDEKDDEKDNPSS